MTQVVGKHRDETWCRWLGSRDVEHHRPRSGPRDTVPSGHPQRHTRVLGEELIERLAPFGRSNRPPSFRLTGVRIAAEPRVFGKQNDHLELQVTDGRGSFLRATWWRSVEHRGLLSKGAAIELVVEPKFDAYRGRREVVGSIRDVRVLEAALDERETASRPATFA